LGYFDGLTVHLAAGGLIKFCGFFHCANSFEQTERAEGICIDGVNGHIEADADVALSAEVVNFVGLNLIDNGGKIRAIGQVAVGQHKLGSFVRVFVEVVDSPRVERGASSDDAPDVIALFQEQFSKIGAVLARYAGNQRLFHRF